MKARITIDVPIELLEWVQDYCQKEKISRNELIKRALEEYKKAREGQK